MYRLEEAGTGSRLILGIEESHHILILKVEGLGFTVQGSRLRV